MRTPIEERLQRIIDRFSFVGGLSLWKPAIRVAQRDERIILTVTLTVPLVGLGRAGPVALQQWFMADSIALMPDDFLEKSVERQIKQAVEHELLESLLLDGKPLEDPHPKPDMEAA